MLSTLLLAALLAFCGFWIQMQQRKLERLQQTLRRYDIPDLERQQESLNAQIRNLQQELRELDAKAYLQSIDSYEPKYDFISSGEYILRLENIKLQQERMRKNELAFICDTQWKIGEGKRGEKEGKKMTDELLKLVEFSFEAQCKYAIKEVKYNNVEYLKQKINKSFDKINRYLKKINCRISVEYLKLKLIELDLQYELEDKKQEEKEKEQELKKQKREGEAIEKARQKAEEAEEREKLHQQELDKVRQEIEQVAQAEVEKRKQLELQIQQLERQIAEDRRDKENANRVKWGYIYIISNIGSLGRDIYRICMTRSNNPDEYIRDMKPVVPFEFDKHFKIFSEDAFDTLEKLNERFADKRVNLLNSRREFFKVSMDEIEQAVKEIARETGVLRIDEFERAPQAYEYRQTLATRKKNQHLTPDDSYLGEDEIA
jgi:hypothetical protein